MWAIRRDAEPKTHPLENIFHSASARVTSDFTQARNTNVKQSQRVYRWRFGLLTAACPRRWCACWCVPSTHPSVRWWPSLWRPWSLWKALQGGCEGKRPWLISSQTCLVGTWRERSGSPRRAFSLPADVSCASGHLSLLFLPCAFCLQRLTWHKEFSSEEQVLE